MDESAFPFDISLLQIFNFVIRAWGESKDKHGATKARKVYDSMADMEIQPDDRCHNSLLNAYVRRTYHDVDILQQATDLYTQLHDDDDNNKDHGGPRKDSICCKLMGAWLKHTNGHTHVERLFQGLQHDLDAGKPVSREFLADACAMRLQSWSKQGDPTMTTNVFHDWIDHVENGRVDRKPTTMDFNAVIDSWTKSMFRDVSKKQALPSGSHEAKQAERCLQQMVELAERGEYDCYPNVFSFTSVISAHARSTHSNSGERALKIFRKQQALAAQQQQQSNSNMRKTKQKHTNHTMTGSNDVVSLEPTIVTYVEVLIALCRHGRVGDKRTESSLVDLLREMQTLPAEQFTTGSSTTRGGHSSADLTWKRLRKLEQELERSGWTHLLSEYERLQAHVSSLVPDRDDNQNKRTME